MKYSENIQAIAELQPDYLGFIFWENSKRRFDLEEIPHFDSKIKKVGVFVDSSMNEITARKNQFDLMKNGAAIVNCSRGGVIDEQALIEALDSGKVAFAGLDVFVNEPTPSKAILGHSKISLTPHTGAATIEAQDRIALSLAEKICSILQVK